MREMQVANGKSERATADVIDLCLANEDLCKRIVACVGSGGDAVAVESILKSEFRGVASKTETSLRKSRVTARGQAEFRSMWWAFERAVDWPLIAEAVMEIGRDA